MNFLGIDIDTDIDIFDKLNQAIDDVTGQDWLGDLVAAGAALASGQYDEFAQHGLDLLEDGFEALDMEEAAYWAKMGSEAVDLASDLYHGRYQEAAAGGIRMAKQLHARFSDNGVSGSSGVSGAVGRGDRATRGPSVDSSPTQEQIADAGAYWGDDILANGTQGFMDALSAGNPSAKAAMKSPSFMMLLQTKMKEESEFISLVSNLIEAEHKKIATVIANMRV